jgi:hypothetical protein
MTASNNNRTHPDLIANTIMFFLLNGTPTESWWCLLSSFSRSPFHGGDSKAVAIGQNELALGEKTVECIWLAPVNLSVTDAHLRRGSR